MAFTKGHKINTGNKYALKHGLRGTHFYGIFKMMKERCTNSKHTNFRYYGGKGIRVEWVDFVDFKNDMYASYLKHITKFGEKNTSIDRIDGNKNYSKENCRWATQKEQGRNKSNNHLISFNGETRTLSEWSEITGIHKCTLRSRLSSPYWSVEKALTFKSK